jgi:hypothetical protein
LIIAAVCCVIILPAIVYQYPYPNHSDDTPRHLEVINRVVAGEGYSDLWEQRNAYAGPAFVGLMIKALHTDPYWTFYVFHYLALIAIVITIWVFTRKVFNRAAANIAVPVVALCTPPFLQYFYNGVIFNMIDLFIFGLLGIMALVYWFQTRRPYYAVVSILLFAIAMLFHSSTGLYLAVGVGIFLGCYTLINAKKRAWGKVRRPVVYGAAFCALCGPLAYYLSPELTRVAGMVYNGVAAGGGAAPERTIISASEFLTGYISIPVVAALVVSLIYIWRRKLQVSVGMGVLAALIFALALNTFVFKVIEPSRSAHDLAMITALAGAGALGAALQRMKWAKYHSAICAGVIMFLALPVLTFWTGYNSAVRPADQEAIACLNELPGESYSVSTQVQPSIYSIFLQGKTYVSDGGEYIVYRSGPMTGEKTIGDIWCKVKGNESSEADYNGLLVVGEFNDGVIRIVIYKNGG